MKKNLDNCEKEETPNYQNKRIDDANSWLWSYWVEFYYKTSSKCGSFDAQLESGVVYYEHQLPEEPFWVVRDSIELSLSSQPAPDVHHILPITISYYAAHSNISSQLWRNKGKWRRGGAQPLKLINDMLYEKATVINKHLNKVIEHNTS